MIPPILIIASATDDIFAIMGELFDCGDYSVTYYNYIGQSMYGSGRPRRRSSITIFDMRGVQSDTLVNLLTFFQQLTVSQTIPVFIALHIPPLLTVPSGCFLKWTGNILVTPLAPGQFLQIIRSIAACGGNPDWDSA